MPVDTIGTLIAKAREAAGMTQAEVAAGRRVTRGAQSQIELPGARPGWDTIDSFARAIDASVVVHFQLANGADVSGRCGGNHCPTLRDDLLADAHQARIVAIGASGPGDRRIQSARREYGEFAAVRRLVEIIEPHNWQMQAVLTVLMSAAVAEPIAGDRASFFDNDVSDFLHDYREVGGQRADVTTVSQFALNSLLHATHLVCTLTRLYATSTPGWDPAALPVRGLERYLANGAVGADEAQKLVDQVSIDAAWRLAILKDAGYVYGEPSDFDELPHAVWVG